MSKLASLRQKKIALISIAAPFAIASAVVGYIFLRNNQLRTDPVEISKQSPIVRSFFEAHPDTRLDSLTRGYLALDGTLYSADRDWNIGSYRGYYGAYTPFDDKNHYCWVVQWRAPYEPGIPNTIWVFVDKDTLEILHVKEGIDM